MSKSVSHDRKITIYPDETLKNLVVAECAITNLSRSDVVSKAISIHYQSMPKEEFKKIQDKAEIIASYPKKQA